MARTPMSFARQAVRRLQAAVWHRRAADGGHVGALAYTGMNLITGTGVRRNVRRGMDFVRQAAERGDDMAMGFLGEAYLFGECGCEVDRRQGVMWLKRSASAGYLDAQALLA